MTVPTSPGATGKTRSTVREIFARRLAAANVKGERFPGLVQDDLGLWTAPGGAKILWFKDPDGNILSLSQLP